MYIYIYIHMCIYIYTHTQIWSDAHLVVNRRLVVIVLQVSRLSIVRIRPVRIYLYINLHIYLDMHSYIYIYISNLIVNRCLVVVVLQIASLPIVGIRPIHALAVLKSARVWVARNPAAARVHLSVEERVVLAAEDLGHGDGGVVRDWEAGNPGSPQSESHLHGVRDVELA